jgi:hypothetical protein
MHFAPACRVADLRREHTDGVAGSAGVEFWTHVGCGCVAGDVRQGNDYIEVSEDRGGLFEDGTV